MIFFWVQKGQNATCAYLILLPYTWFSYCCVDWEHPFPCSTKTRLLGQRYIPHELSVKMGEIVVLLYYSIKKSFPISLISFNETNCEKVELPWAEFVVCNVYKKRKRI